MTILISTIPKEIDDAALILGNYFARQNARQWAVGEVCSRRWKEDLESELCTQMREETCVLRSLLREICEWLTGGDQCSFAA
jgi:hypothetical protein